MGDDFDCEAEQPLAANLLAEGPLKRDLVAGLEKGLCVIEAFDQERPRLTISEVAERTGLKKGDLIVQAAGKPANRLRELIALVRAQPEGTWLPLQVKRGEETHELLVKFPPAP